MAALKQLRVRPEANSMNVHAIPAGTYVNARSLGAGVAETVAVPAGAVFAVFSATADFYAAYDTTAAVPTDIADGTASELNPTVRDVSGVANISLISQATPIITVAFYS